MVSFVEFGFVGFCCLGVLSGWVAGFFMLMCWFDFDFDLCVLSAFGTEFDLRLGLFCDFDLYSTLELVFAIGQCTKLLLLNLI